MKSAIRGVFAASAVAAVAILAGAGCEKGVAPLATVKIDASRPGRAIPAGYLGFSHEWGEAQIMVGDPAIGVNLIYRQLLANLAGYGGGPISIRVGGSTTDRTAAPRANTVTPFARLYEDLAMPTPAASFILSVNMGANDTALAASQARAFVQGMPAGSILAIELGNQPDCFALDRHRPAGNRFDDYLREFRAFTTAIRAAVPDCPPFMGPSMGGLAGPPSAPMAPQPDFGTPANIERLLQQKAATLGIVSQHPRSGGNTIPDDHSRPGVLLQPTAATEAPEAAGPYIAVATAAKKPYRLVEMNRITAMGKPGVGDAFEAALWTADILFEYAARGVAGVNLHAGLRNTPHGREAGGTFLFDVPERQYRAANAGVKPPHGTRFPTHYQLRAVCPPYYGMLFFAEATANRGQLLPVTLSTKANLKVWATIDGSSRIVRVAIVNKDTTAAGVVRLRAPGYKAGAAKRLLAPSFGARSGITYGGLTFDGSRDGHLVGSAQGEPVTGEHGTFEVVIAAASAVLLTLHR